MNKGKITGILLIDKETKKPATETLPLRAIIGISLVLILLGSALIINHENEKVLTSDLSAQYEQ